MGLIPAEVCPAEIGKTKIILFALIAQGMLQYINIAVMSGFMN